MITFGSPWWLAALAALPVIAWLRGKGGRPATFVYSSLVLVKGITELSRTRAGAVLINLRWLALALLIFALARPQLPGGESPLRASGIDIAVALDLSGSMESEDFELNGRRANRLAVAKDVLATFIDHRATDRIGLIAFATDAFVAAPPTLDHDFVGHVLKRLEIGVINGNSTAIGSAISCAANRLRTLKSKSRIVILMTDGQNNAGNLPPLTAAEAAKALGVKIYTIGVGTHGFAPRPVTDQFGRRVYVKEAVDIDEESLKKIAAMTGGKYYRADKTETLRRIYSEIDQLEKNEVQTKRHAYFDELMAWFAIPALGLLALEIVLGQTVWRKLP
jgi:Ca-activated chloride channel homolog